MLIYYYNSKAYFCFQGKIERVKIMNENINQYGYYRTEYVEQNKLPHLLKINNTLTWANAEALKDGTVLLSKSRCEELKVPMGKNERPVAYKKILNSYCALFNRTNKVIIDNLYMNEIYRQK